MGVKWNELDKGTTPLDSLTYLETMSEYGNEAHQSKPLMVGMIL